MGATAGATMGAAMPGVALAEGGTAGLDLTGSEGYRTGALPQPASIPTMQARLHHTDLYDMTLLLLEALGAGLIFVGIIWWTMFSGRKNGELPDDRVSGDQPESDGK